MNHVTHLSHQGILSFAYLSLEEEECSSSVMAITKVAEIEYEAGLFSESKKRLKAVSTTILTDDDLTTLSISLCRINRIRGAIKITALVQSHHKRAFVLAQIAGEFLQRKRIEEAKVLLQICIKAIVEENDLLSKVRALIFVFGFLKDAHLVQSAENTLLEAYRRTLNLENTGIRFHLFARIAIGFLKISCIERAKVVIKAALLDLKNAEDPSFKSRALAILARIQFKTPCYFVALAYLEHACITASKIKDQYQRASVLLFIAKIYAFGGVLKRAYVISKEALHAAQDVSFNTWKKKNLAYQATKTSAYISQQLPLEETEGLLTLDAAKAAVIKDPLFQTLSLIKIAKRQRQLMLMGSCLETLNKAVLTSESILDPNGKSHCLAFIGEAYLQINERELAFEIAKKIPNPLFRLDFLLKLIKN